MKVRTPDGRKLGRVTELGPRCFVTERGFFFPREYELLYREVAEIRGDEVWLGLPRLDAEEELPDSGGRESGGADTTAPLLWVPPVVTYTVDPSALTRREATPGAAEANRVADGHEPAPAP